MSPLHIPGIPGFSRFEGADRDITVGVLSDTHVPDTQEIMHPAINKLFKSEEISLILHAGDVSTQQVLDELGKIAPTYAVRGNRDIFHLSKLPLHRQFSFYGNKVVLIHGYTSWIQYFSERIAYVFRGYQFERYRKRLSNAYPDANVIVYGHSHYPEMKAINNQLFYNPGSTSTTAIGVPKCIGLIAFKPTGEVIPRHIPID